jgi:integrase
LIGHFHFAILYLIDDDRVMSKSRKRARGDGTVVELPSGKWRGQISGGIDITTGQRLRKSATFETEKEARAWLRTMGGDRERGLVDFTPATDQETLGEWLDVFLADKRATTEPGTYRDYELTLNKHVRPSLGSVKLKKVAPDLVARWRDTLAERGASPATIRKAMLHLSIVLNAAVVRDKIAKNPAKKVKRPKHKPKEVEALTRDEVGRLLSALRGERLEPLFRTWLDTGCRGGELLALHWQEVDLTTGTIRIIRSLEEIKGKYRLKDPKSNAGRRTIRVSPETVALLTAHRDRVEGELVFSSRVGGFIGRGSVAESWRRILKKEKIRYRKPYVLRHTSASLLLSSGVSLKAVSKRLGHEDPVVTLRTYSHLLREDEEQTVRVLSDLFSGHATGTRPPNGTRTG